MVRRTNNQNKPTGTISWDVLQAMHSIDKASGNDKPETVYIYMMEGGTAKTRVMHYKGSRITQEEVMDLARLLRINIREKVIDIVLEGYAYVALVYLEQDNVYISDNYLFKPLTQLK